MNTDCEVIRDLMPLYADGVCSQKSREMVESHIRDCPECRDMLARMADDEIEENLHTEKEAVIRYGEKRFRRRSATVGSTVAGLFMIPILVCLIVNLTTGAGLGWFFVVLASLGVAASLIVTPLTVPEDKLFWTFCTFCASLVGLLAVVCLYSHGRWFWIAASAALFGLSAVFLPFAVRAKPLKKLIGGTNRWLIVLGVDAALFVNMMNMISARHGFGAKNLMLAAGTLAGIGLAVFEILRQGGKEQ